MPTPYCPNCDYNLTGLPENRCPACGNPFDPVTLERYGSKQCRPPGRAMITARCAGLVVVFWATSVGFVITVGPESAFPIMALFIIATMGNAYDISRRLALARAVLRGRTPAALLDRLDLDREPGVGFWRASLLAIQWTAGLLPPVIALAILVSLA